MKVLREGHLYQLANLEDDGHPEQKLQFIEKMPSAIDKNVLQTVKQGTTNEEVLAVLIDRYEHLDKKLHHDYNTQILHHLRSALELQNRRSAERQQRGVTDTAQP